MASTTLTADNFEKTVLGEDMIMGVPSGPPKWIFAALAGAVILGALVIFLIVR